MKHKYLTYFVTFKRSQVGCQAAVSFCRVVLTVHVILPF